MKQVKWWVGRTLNRIRTPFELGCSPSPASMTSNHKTMVVAGGCFWGVQAVFQHVRGVTSAISGYAGGTAATANYEAVSSRRTGRAESVQVTYDASVITYGQLLWIFFAVAHDATELNRQGPDVGPEYRSAIFVGGDDERQIAQAYIAQVTKAGAFRRDIVTEVTPLSAFHRAEDYHQNYATLNPQDAYIRINDAPKIAHLKAAFPGIYLTTPVLVR